MLEKSPLRDEACFFTFQFINKGEKMSHTETEMIFFETLNNAVY